MGEIRIVSPGKTRRQASTLGEISTPRVRFPYPIRTLKMDCYNRSLAISFLY